MNTRPNRVTTLPQKAGNHSRASTWAAKVRQRVHVVREGWLQVFGIPDYERYLVHRAIHHPGDAVLSRRDFFAQAIDRKYCRSGPRCC